jgi:signal transduction histidine kinase
MTDNQNLLSLVHRRALPVAGVLAIALATVEVAVDWLTWIEFNEAIVYTLPLILAAAARNRKLLWSLAAVMAFTTFAVYYVQIPAGVFSIREPYFVDRVLAAVTLATTAALLHALTLAMDSIEKKNSQLSSANNELLQLRDEIMRQNDELDERRRDAEEASTRKTRMIASVSHDIRSPLNAINLMAQVLKSSAGDPVQLPDVTRMAERLQANVHSVSDLVADVLDISKIDSGRIDLNETSFDLMDLMVEQCQILEPLALSRGLYLIVEPLETGIRIFTDRIKLARVIANLITNAVKFTDDGGVALSAVISAGGDVVISVRDTGRGISAEDQSQIFDEFAQVRSADARAGWGLGLAICRRLAASIGGSISIQSEPEKGSTFSVHLPASCVEHQPNARAAANQ